VRSLNLSTFCLLTYFTAITGNDPFTTEAALASVSEGDDTPFQMPLPEMRKTRTAVKAEDPGFPVKETIAHATVCNAEGHEATSGCEVRRYG